MRIRAAIRIGLRASWRDRWRTLLCAAFVALAIGISQLLLASVGGSSGVDGARARITLVGHGTASEPAPVVRVGPRDVLDVQALGAGQRMTFGASGSGTGELVGDRVPTVTAPAGTTVLTFHSDTTRVQHGDRAVAVDVDDADLGAPSGALEGTIGEGRAPVRPGEVAATADLLETLRARIGSGVILRSGVLAGTHATIVGVLVRGEDGDTAPKLLVAPGLLVASAMRTFEASIPPSGLSASVSGGGQSTVSSSAGPTEAPGPTSSMVKGGSSGPRGLAVALYVLAIYETLLLVLPMLLTIAVLAVGMSRRLDELRLLALSGATTRFIGLVAAVRGVVIALLGGALGVGCTAAGAALVGATATPDLAALALPVVPALITSIWASRAATGAATRIGTIRDQVDRSALGRDALFGAALCAASPALVFLAGRLGATGPLVVLPGIAIAGLGVYRLARVAVWLPGALPLPPALRAAVRATGRARWVSAPAAFGVGLVAIVATGMTGSTESGNPPASAPALVYVMPGSLANAGGAEINPRSLVTRIVPAASRVVPIWALDGSTPTDPGLAVAYRWLVSKRDAATIGIPTASLDGSNPIDVGAPGGWPQTVPHIFQTGAPRADAGVPVWLVRVPSGTTAAQLTGMVAAAADAGLQLASDVEPAPGSSSGTSLTARAITAAIALLFGAVACAIVLAETREEPRRLALAGARPRDLRLAAGAAAFALGIGALLVGLVLAALLATAGAWAAASGGLPALIALPFVLGVGAAVLTRPPRLDGRVGRPIRDAGSRTLTG